MKQTLKSIDLDMIEFNPNNLRRSFEPGAIEELATSIEYIGLIEPPVVVKNGDTFMLVAGERRVRACHFLVNQNRWEGDKTIRCLVSTRLEAELETAVFLIENMQRVDLTAAEQAVGVIELAVTHEMTEAEIASSLGVSKSWVKDRVAISQLSPFILDQIGGKLTLHHAVMLANLPDDMIDKLTKDNKIPTPFDVENRDNQVKSEKRATQLYRKLDKAGHMPVTEAELKKIMAADIGSLDGKDFLIKSIIGQADEFVKNYWDKPETVQLRAERAYSPTEENMKRDTIYMLKKVGGFHEWYTVEVVVPQSMKKEEDWTEDEKLDNEYERIDQANAALREQWLEECKEDERKYLDSSKPAEMVRRLLWNQCSTLFSNFRGRQLAEALDRLRLPVTDDDAKNLEEFQGYISKNSANLTRGAFVAALHELKRDDDFDIEYTPTPEYAEYPEEEEEYDASNDPFEETA